MSIDSLDTLAFELAKWDFLSISAILLILLGISEKIPLGGLGFSIFIYKILGGYWCTSFVTASVFLCCINWYQHNQIENALSSLGNGFEGMKEEIQGIKEECEKIRKTINPYEQYMDELSDY